MAWILLILGGICEVGFTTCLQESDHLADWSKNWPWAIGFPVNLWRIIFIFMLIASIAGLKAVSH
jgi:multidrug transporter EmrE-like cation transporter